MPKNKFNLIALAIVVLAAIVGAVFHRAEAAPLALLSVPVLMVGSVLTAAAEIPRKIDDLVSYPIGAVKIWKGSLVCIGTDGYAVVGADTAGYRFVGVAYETVDNSAGSAGALEIRVFNTGVHKIPGASITQAMVGRKMYVSDSGAMDDSSTNRLEVGVLVRYESTTSGWVDIGRRADLVGYQDHFQIITDKSDKNIRLNSKTFSDADASIVGVQIKPRAGIALTNGIIGLEVMPGVNSGITGKDIVGVKVEPYIHSAGGALSGYVTAFECTLGKPSGAGTVTGVMSALRVTNNCDNTITGGVFVIDIEASGGGKAWDGLLKLPAEAGLSGTTSPSTLAGYIQVKQGSNTRYIALYSSATGG